MKFEFSFEHALLVTCLMMGCEASPSPQTPLPQTPTRASSDAQVIRLTDSSAAIEIDDIRFCRFPDAGESVVVSTGRGENVRLVNPITGRVMPVSGAEDLDLTSADGDFDGLFAVDRTSKKLLLADPATTKIVGSAPLAAEPAYVRYFVPFRQVWVTEPKGYQIEVFNMPKVGDMTAAFVEGGAPVRETVIAVKGGPGAFVFDIDRMRAYTNLRAGGTASIDTTSYAIVGTWPNGCTESRGIDLDMAGGFLFVACAEGKVVVLDVKTGSQVGSLAIEGGASALAFAKELRHLYVPSSTRETMTVVGVSAKGEPSILGTAPSAASAPCVAADAGGNAYVCAPKRNAILKVKDPHPATR
jgi:hypothetical protein